MLRKIGIPLLIGGIMIFLLVIVSSDLPVVLVFIPGVIITLLIHFNITAKKKLNPKNVLPLYLFALGIQFLHFAEEYVMGFTVAMPDLLGQAEYAVTTW